MDALLAGQAQFVQVPEPLEQMLKEKYDSRVVVAGLDRAVEQAQGLRAVSDSAKASQPRPPSAVPVPGPTPPGAAPSGAPPTGSPPPAGR
jgi:hypothetical protein